MLRLLLFANFRFFGTSATQDSSRYKEGKVIIDFCVVTVVVQTWLCDNAEEETRKQNLALALVGWGLLLLSLNWKYCQSGYRIWDHHPSAWNWYFLSFVAVVIYGLVFRLRTSYLSVWSSFSFDSIKGGEINYLQKELLHPHKIYCFAWIGWTDTKRNRMVGGGWAITGAIPGASEDSDGTDDDTEEAQKVDAIGTLKNK